MRGLLVFVLGASLAVLGASLAACGSEPQAVDRAAPPGTAASALPAVVQTDRGPMSVEDEYLPGVVDCELSHFTTAAGALEAQAIAARTYLARALAARGAELVVRTTAAFQCWRAPVHPGSAEAVRRTRGQVARWRGQLINANYAAGTGMSGMKADCTPLPPTAAGYDYPSWTAMRVAYLMGARPHGGWRGAGWTQIFVTWNLGRRADRVTPTVLRNFGAPNRGALGQHATICLAERYGLDAAAILRAFYGEDLEVG